VLDACNAVGRPGFARLEIEEGENSMQTMNSKWFAILVCSLCFGCTAIAQQAAPATPAAAASAPAPSPAQRIGLFAFPRNNQSADQQLRDETDCYSAARQRTGIDSQTPPPGLSDDEIRAAQLQATANAQQGPRRLGGALRGAAGGAAIGAFTGNPGAGAGIGAVSGTMSTGAARRGANAQSQQQVAAAVRRAEEELLRQHMQGIDAFQRAFAACMESRNYSVK
jgi:hypothetical protein